MSSSKDPMDIQTHELILTAFPHETQQRVDAVVAMFAEADVDTIQLLLDPAQYTEYHELLTAIFADAALLAQLTEVRGNVYEYDGEHGIGTIDVV